MNKWLVALLGFGLSVQAAAGGKLLVVGGALTSSNEAVYRALIDDAKGAPIAIVPVASGRPMHYANQFKRDLLHYGVDESAIHLVPLAVVDDSSTAVDESAWAGNAHNQKLVASLKNVRHYWFVGGDQTRITQTLLTEQGKDTPLLAHIRAQLAAGGVVGGTSAGAAMMSAQMIAAGDSVSALIAPASQDYPGMEAQEQGALHIRKGLGFWPGVLVDQHFDRKARLGRLAAAMCEVPKVLGVGIDEDTGAWVDLSTNTFTAIGRGNVTVLNAADARCNWVQGQRDIRDLELSLLSRGDSYTLTSNKLTPAPGKHATRGNEAFGGAVVVGGGMAVGNQRLDELLGFELLDNADSDRVERWTHVKTASGVKTLRYVFGEQKSSQGYWAYLDGTKDMYTIGSATFSILPGAVHLAKEVRP
ncbi:cyanophycinase [Simiduia sp. 21SJ11W-1]|uniref:cyanophycinase n=1 Tax=Simiduia sp. 21SJ11W-1 TaxID=2909669 RepID=UPI0020A06AD4|nr:cyanophycinase [Simiduia sp. 21SJ11W-1]UTA47716.1 cyanophycinase [Simiduia sp. 21SJ11W-1]